MLYPEYAYTNFNVNSFQEKWMPQATRSGPRVWADASTNQNVNLGFAYFHLRPQENWRKAALNWQHRPALPRAGINPYYHSFVRQMIRRLRLKAVPIKMRLNVERRVVAMISATRNLSSDNPPPSLATMPPRPRVLSSSSIDESMQRLCESRHG